MTLLNNHFFLVLCHHLCSSNFRYGDAHYDRDHQGWATRYVVIPFISFFLFSSLNILFTARFSTCTEQKTTTTTTNSQLQHQTASLGHHYHDRQVVKRGTQKKAPIDVNDDIFWALVVLFFVFLSFFLYSRKVPHHHHYSQEHVVRNTKGPGDVNNNVSWVLGKFSLFLLFTNNNESHPSGLGMVLLVNFTSNQIDLFFFKVLFHYLTLPPLPSAGSAAADEDNYGKCFFLCLFISNQNLLFLLGSFLNHDNIESGELSTFIN